LYWSKSLTLRPSGFYIYRRNLSFNGAKEKKTSGVGKLQGETSVLARKKEKMQSKEKLQIFFEL
jgi:hypothetical protein